MTLAAFTLALLDLVGPRSATFAPVLHQEAARANLPPALVAAVAFQESSLRPSARGRAGEVGLMQIHPRGLATVVCRGLNVRTTRGNVRCGARILAHVRARCGGSPARWLSAYSGRRCGPSAYSARVLAVVRRLGA